MHLASVDLNLLVAFDALLAERHVTRAGRRIGLSQSATSHALTRLRELFDDPLFVRSAGGMQPTARAESLAAPVRRALVAAEEALAAARPFDPATTVREVRVVAGDFAELVLVPSVARRLEVEAPGIDLDVLPASGDAYGMLRRAEAELVLGLARGSERTAGLHHAVLFDEGFACLVRRGHPLTRGRMTLKRWLGARHAMIAPGGRRGGVVDDLLAGRGVSRRIAVLVPHFLVAPFVIAETDLVLTLPERVARLFAGVLPIEVLRPPIEVPGFTISCSWHERSDADACLAWVRGVFVDEAARRATRRRQTR